MADGAVVISVNMDSSKADKEIQNLTHKIEGLESKLQSNKQKQLPLQKKLEQLTVEADTAARKLHEMQNAPVGTYPAEQISTQNETVRALGVLWNETQRQVQKCNKEIENTAAKLEQAKVKYGELQQQIIATEQSSDAASGKMEQARTKMQLFAAEAGQMFKNAGAGFSDIFKNVLSNVIGKLTSLLKSIPSKVSSMAKKAASALKTITSEVLSLAQRLNVFSKISRALSGTVKRLGQSIKQAFVFSVIYKGLSLVKEQLSSYLLVNEEFSAALSRIKGALLTAFQPIYDAVVPALTTLLNILSRVIAAVTQFTASLFGGTAKQAQNNAKALYEQANATEAAGNAAEEAAGSLASFDEINTLSSGSSSAGGTTTGNEATPTFEMELDDTVFNTWGQAFDAFLDNLLDKGIPSLEAGLSAMAEKVNSFSEKMLEMFTFPGVVDKVKAVGKNLATAFNDFVVSIDWNRLGQAIGAGLNTAIAFAVAFLYSVDWQNIGASLASMLNGIVAQIDWYNFGLLLFSGFKIGLETLAGFIIGLDMVQLALAASELVIGFMNSVTETLAGIDWEGIGRQVKEFLVNVDWAGVAESTFTAIGAAFGALTAFLWGLIQDAWKEVVNWWHDVAYEDGKFTLEGLLNGISDVVSNIGHWLKEHVVDPFVEGFKKLFGIHSPSTVMAELGRYLMDGLMGGVTDKISAVVATFAGLWEKIKEVFSHISDWFKGTFSDAWQAVKDVFSSGGKIFDGIKDGILNGLKAVINALISGINKVISVPFNGINTALKTIRNASILGVKPFSWISTIAIPQIPKLAQGAVIPPNREFMAILGDQKSGNNIEAPESLIRRIVREEAGGMNTELLEDILEAIKAGHSIKLDGREIARNSVRHINDMTKSRGKSILLV